MYGYTCGNGFNIPKTKIHIRANIYFVENNNRGSSAIPGERKVSLDPAKVEISTAIQTAHNEDSIYISRYNLFSGTFSCDFPGKLAFSRQ
jgi:hypothetical protein